MMIAPSNHPYITLRLAMNYVEKEKSCSKLMLSKKETVWQCCRYGCCDEVCNGSRQQSASYVGLGPDLGSMAPDAAPPGLREREGGPWAPPPGLKDWVRWSWLLLRCIGRTGLSIMLSCLEGILLQPPHMLAIGPCPQLDSHYSLHDHMSQPS